MATGELRDAFPKNIPFLFAPLPRAQCTPIWATFSLLKSVKSKSVKINFGRANLKNSHILPTGQWYAPSAVNNPAW